MARFHHRHVQLSQSDRSRHERHAHDRAGERAAAAAGLLTLHRYGLALALSALVVAGAAACTRVSENASGPKNGGTIPGTLRYADVQEVSGLNPLLRAETVGTDLDMFIFGYFYNLDDKANPVPELATDIPTVANGGISKDGKSIRYHLRQGVKWQDGAPFTAHDAVFTFKAIMNPANHITTTSGWDKIDRVEEVNDHEIVVHMKEVFGPSIGQFWAYGGLVPVMPAHLLEKYPNINQVPFNQHPIGTGPFKFVKWVHGDHIELEANPNYWRGAPKLKRVIYRFIPSENTILTQLKTHEIDAWFRAPANFYPEFQQLSEYKVQLQPASLYSHFDLNLKNPLFGDVRVRRAINYGIDKGAIIHKVTHDVHMPAFDDLPPSSWAYEPNVMKYPYDPDKARQLLDEAGWTPGPDGIRRKNGTPLSFLITYVIGGKNGEQTAQIIIQNMKALGIQASVKPYPANLLFDNYQNGGILQTGKYDAALFAWNVSADPDSNSIYSCDQIPPKGQNNMFWCDKTLTDAEHGQLGSLDQAVRKRFFSIVEKELASQSPTIFLYHQREVHVTSPNLSGFKPAPISTSNWNTWEWEMR